MMRFSQSYTYDTAAWATVRDPKLQLVRIELRV
jgi:hypothetical protein